MFFYILYFLSKNYKMGVTKILKIFIVTHFAQSANQNLNINNVQILRFLKKISSFFEIPQKLKMLNIYNCCYFY